MAAVSVGTTPVQLSVSGRQRPVIQNLGAGNLYVGEDNSVSSSNGLKLPANSVFEYISTIAEDGEIWVVADASGTDVRYLALGG